MILVADASALIALATCDSLALLDAIFGNVLVQDAVYATRSKRLVLWVSCFKPNGQVLSHALRL